MLRLAMLLLSAAVALGGVVALRHLRSGSAKPRHWWLVGLAHGAAGVCGLGALAVALGGPPRGEAMGVAGFGQAAAWAFAVAACLGAAIPLLFSRGGQSSGLSRGGWGGLVMAAHAAVAITGYVVFLAWWALG